MTDGTENSEAGQEKAPSRSGTRGAKVLSNAAKMAAFYEAQGCFSRAEISERTGLNITHISNLRAQANYQDEIAHHQAILQDRIQEQILQPLKDKVLEKFLNVYLDGLKEVAEILQLTDSEGNPQSGARLEAFKALNGSPVGKLLFAAPKTAGDDDEGAAGSGQTNVLIIQLGDDGQPVVRPAADYTLPSDQVRELPPGP